MVMTIYVDHIYFSIDIQPILNIFLWMIA